MIRLSKRNVNRLALIALIAAPLLYLFGTQFAALAGAHGQQLFANDVVSSVSYTTNFAKNFWMYENGEVYTLSVPSFLSDYITLYDSSTFTISNIDTPFYASILSCYDENGVFVVRQIYIADRYSSSISFDVSGYRYVRFGVSYQSFEDSAPSSISVDLSSSLNPEGIVVYNRVIYSDYLFGQFFSRDNFLTEWGENSISDDPLGFAPIGNFYQWLDVNLLHLSDSQIGLMAYGYSYYLAHVLLFDLFFYTCTFFISFLFGLFDKFGGSGL